MLIRWQRIVGHLAAVEQVESSASKPAANAVGSLQRSMSPKCNRHVCSKN